MLLKLTSVFLIALLAAILHYRYLIQKQSNHWAWLFILPSSIFFALLQLFIVVTGELFDTRVVAISYVLFYLLLLYLVKKVNNFNQIKISSKLKAAKQKTSDLQYQVLKSKNVIDLLKRSLQEAKKIIAINVDNAHEYIDCLNRILRYLLQSRDLKKVELNDELQILDDLYLLHQYQNNISLNIINNVNPKVGGKNYEVPPFVLQILLDKIFLRVEILKISEIELYLENEVYLVIKYNKFYKTKKFGAGFSIIISELQDKYRAVGELEQIQTIITQAYNYIKLPLIKK